MRSFVRSRVFNFGFVFLFLFQAQISKAGNPSYPLGPDLRMTPGSLCKSSKVFRYPEKIPYCNRDVDSNLKQEVITAYVKRFGYKINSANRSSFKIDHYIPLCMGGSNEADNLWPQHANVYSITDEIEHLSCIKMAEGKLRQMDAVQLIKRVKNKLSEASAVLQYLGKI